MLVLFGFMVGIVTGLLIELALFALFQPYLLIVIVATLNTILGEARVWLEGTFSGQVLMVFFPSNVFIAGSIVFAGDQIGVGSQSPTGVVVMPGTRIFNDIAAI